MTGPELARLEVTLSFMMGRVDSLLRLALWREARVYVGYIQRCGLRLNSPSQGKNRYAAARKVSGVRERDWGGIEIGAQ